MDLLVSERHYLDHAAPVWFALPPEVRGTVWAAGKLANTSTDLVDAGITHVRYGVPPPGTLTLVASYQDTRMVRGPVVYVEHGAGQRYDLGDGRLDPSYAGGAEHDNVVLFLCPREEVAGWWRAAYPRVPAVVVGCPKLDHLSRARDTVWRLGKRRPLRKTVAVSFHHEARLVPETVGAWAAYDPILPAFVGAMRSEGVEVLGHAHPRLWSRLSVRWEELGVEAVRDFGEVVRRSSVYCCDNSSTLPEAAAAGLALVWLEAPWWRHHIHHGGRFWSWPEGQVQVHDPIALGHGVLQALRDSTHEWGAREEMLTNIYGPLDGKAAARAAEAIMAIIPAPGTRDPGIAR